MIRIRGILVKRREDFKRFVVFCLASLVVIAQTAVFAYIWYDFYRGLIFEPFWRKGNWVLIAIYALINVLFSRLYGGLKVGYLKRIDVFYSMTIATICTNVITYFQITLINRWFLDPWPMVEMTLVQFVIILIWIWLSRYIYSRLYRARKLLVIYGDRDPGDLIHKMNSRKDKYDISGKVHIDAGEKEIYRLMKEYDGVIIWDLPSQIRNRYLKHCFAHSIRCYLSPKISDVILMGSERIHLFDTPLLVAKNMGLSVEQRAAKRLLDIKAYHMKVTTENGVIEDNFIYGMVTNSRSVGGFKNLTKDVDMNDGLFEVTLIVQPKNPLEMQEIVRNLLNMEDNSDLIYSFKARKLTVEAEEEVAWTLDGEYGGSPRLVEIENLQQALNLCLKSDK